MIQLMNVNQEQSKSTYKWIYSKTPPLNIYKLTKYGSELPIQRPACSKKAAVTVVNINVQMMLVCLEKAVTAVNINV